MISGLPDFSLSIGFHRVVAPGCATILKVASLAFLSLGVYSEKAIGSLSDLKIVSTGLEDIVSLRSNLPLAPPLSPRGFHPLPFDPILIQDLHDETVEKPLNEIRGFEERLAQLPEKQQYEVLRSAIVKGGHYDSLKQLIRDPSLVSLNNRGILLDWLERAKEWDTKKRDLKRAILENYQSPRNQTRMGLSRLTEYFLANTEEILKAVGIAYLTRGKDYEKMPGFIQYMGRNGVFEHQNFPEILFVLHATNQAAELCFENNRKAHQIVEAQGFRFLQVPHMGIFNARAGKEILKVLLVEKLEIEGHHPAEFDERLYWMFQDPELSLILRDYFSELQQFWSLMGETNPHPLNAPFLSDGTGFALIDTDLVKEMHPLRKPLLFYERWWNRFKFLFLQAQKREKKEVRSFCDFQPLYCEDSYREQKERIRRFWISRGYLDVRSPFVIESSFSKNLSFHEGEIVQRIDSLIQKTIETRSGKLKEMSPLQADRAVALPLAKFQGGLHEVTLHNLLDVVKKLVHEGYLYGYKIIGENQFILVYC